MVRSVRHEDYDDLNVTNDIALLELEEEVDLKIYTPVCLPDSEDSQQFIGKYGWIYGRLIWFQFQYVLRQ